MEKTWKPAVGGILSICAGAIPLIIGLIFFFGEGYRPVALLWFLPFLIPFTIMPIVGGVLAIQRKNWLATLICFCCGIPNFYLIVPAIILVVMSKKEFT